MILETFPEVGMGTSTPLAVPEQLRLAPTFMIVTMLIHHESQVLCSARLFVQLLSYNAQGTMSLYDM